MKQYDFRFDTALIKSFIGKTFVKYKHADFMYTNSVTAVLSFEIEDVAYELTNEFEAMDFLTLDCEATIFRISKTKWNNVDSMINNDINEINVGETIKRILLVNDHTTLNIDENVEYDMWDTKAINFCFENHELCFMKQDCWFSHEIEIYKGRDLLAKIGGGNGILDDFDEDDAKKVFVERKIIEIK